MKGFVLKNLNIKVEKKKFTDKLVIITRPNYSFNKSN